MNHWIRPSCDSRTGASHLRRGAPCQDASGFAGFLDAAGTPVQVLVVSDGHGGSRYVRSDVGARLACEVALRTVEQTLRTSRTGQAGSESEWRQWLAETLPQAIVEAWLEEVQRHWQAQGPQGSESVPASLPALAAGSAEAAAAASPAGFSPIPYGATLGLLVLTPRWWGYTGLGDWDLVRIEAAGEGRLISEESEAGGGSEATYSLCMQGAARYFAPRTALLPLTVDTAPFALLLCSDGLRKSCGSDADFLTLCRYLVGLAPAADQDISAELAEALDHISRQGSGDDISVALARWAAAGQAAGWPGPGRSLPPRLVQPAPEVVSGLPVDAAAADGVVAAGLGATSPSEGTSGVGVAAPLPGAATGASAPPIASRRVGPTSSGPQPAAGRRPSASVHRRGRQRLVVALVLLGLGGAGLVIAAVLGRGPLAGRREPASLVLTSRQRSDLQRQVALLCDSAAVPGGGQEPAGEALERGTAAVRGADAARSGIASAGRGPAPVAGSSAATGAPPLPGRQPAATTTGRIAGTPATTGSGDVAKGSTVPPRSGMAQGAAGPLRSTAEPATPVAGALSSGATAAARPPDPQRLQRIAATLAARASIFQRLERGEPARVTTALSQSQADPLTALIAYSATDPTLRPAPPPPERTGWWSSLGRHAAGLLPFATRPGGSSPEAASPVAELGACPELTLALRAAWQRQDSPGAVQSPAAPSPAAVPLRAGGDGRAPSGQSGPAGAPRAAAARMPASPDPGASSR